MMALSGAIFGAQAGPVTIASLQQTLIWAMIGLQLFIAVTSLRVFSPERVVLYDDETSVTLTVVAVGVEADSGFVVDRVTPDSGHPSGSVLSVPAVRFTTGPGIQTQPAVACQPSPRPVASLH